MDIQMVITRELIDKLCEQWSMLPLDMKEILEQSKQIPLFISQEDFRYFILKFCELRIELDEAIEENYGDDL